MRWLGIGLLVLLYVLVNLLVGAFIIRGSGNKGYQPNKWRLDDCTKPKARKARKIDAVKS